MLGLIGFSWCTRSPWGWGCRGDRALSLTGLVLEQSQEPGRAAGPGLSAEGGSRRPGDSGLTRPSSVYTDLPFSLLSAL